MSPMLIRSLAVAGLLVIGSLGVFFVIHQGKPAPTAAVEEQVASTTTTDATTTETSSTTKAVVINKTPTNTGETPIPTSGKNTKGPELASIAGYINTGGSPITIGQFTGKKVVLLHVWSSSCINCTRTIPYLKAWQQKYGDALEIIGVHTPQFSFEYGKDFVAAAATNLGITYPIVLDNKRATWNALGNEYWPSLYLVGIDGNLVYKLAGGGNFDKTEQAIQAALVARNQKLGLSSTIDTSLVQPVGVIPVDFTKIQSPESYFGSERNDRLGNAILWTEGEQSIALPSAFKQNAIYLGGTWNFTEEYAQNETGGDIRYVYSARSVYFVAGAASGVTITVTRDGGKPLGDARGKDVDANGQVTVSGSRAYQLINDENYGVHTLEVHIEGTGLKAYIFTFG